MKECNRKFTMTKALYIMLWVLVIYWLLWIVINTIYNLECENWYPIGLLYEGCVWDYLMFATTLILTLSFKKKKDPVN